jgi:hypothetical protein
LLGSAGLDAGACEERAERRGVPLTELRFERRCSGDDMVGCVVFFPCKVAVYHFLRGVLFCASQAIDRLVAGDSSFRPRNPHGETRTRRVIPGAMFHWIRRDTLMLQALEQVRRAMRGDMTHVLTSETSIHINY